MAYETTDELLAEISDHWVKDHRGNLYKLFDTYNGGLEQISDMANKVEKWRAIQDAEGATLDLFGQDLSTSRPTKEDDPYRFLLRLKVLLSRAQGTIPSIVKITSTALGTTQDIKIWNTAAPRHIGIQLPWDYINDVYIQRFLVDNLQHMLALGYWIDEIKFVSTSHLKLYAGLGSQEKSYESHYSKMKWWTGWKAKTSLDLYVGVGSTSLKHESSTVPLKWWTGWKAKADCPFYVGVIGSTVKTTTYKSKLKWSDDQKEEIHAGLTIGNKTITTTTQSIKTE